MAITLYGEPLWDSPYVFTAFVALTEKGVPFTVKEIALDRGEQRGAGFRAAITARVPAIDHDGFWLSESQAIAEYVDEVFDGPKLLPAGPRERARARQVLGWLRSDLMALRQERSTETMFYERAKEPLSPAAEAAAAKLIAVADALIPPGATQLFEHFTVADSDLAFMLHRLILNGHEVPERIRAFATQQWARPSVRAFVEHPRPHR